MLLPWFLEFEINRKIPEGSNNVSGSCLEIHADQHLMVIASMPADF
jgi:hypothetical protein